VAHCETPACASVAGVLRVLTPFGDPVCCDLHAAQLAAVWPQRAAWTASPRTVQERLLVAWVEWALRVGPAEYAARVAWLEGSPAPGRLV
jgi:hypothetical protein